MSKPDSRSRDLRPFDPADRARLFTVSLRDSHDGALSGRLTHVASGEANYFDSGDELVTMLQRAQRGG